MVAGPRELGVHAFKTSLAIEAFFANAERLRVMHGAARGVDTIAARCADRHGHTVIPFPVNDDDRQLAALKRGSPRKAPLERTIRMLDSARPDLVQAWWDGESPGTGFTISEARRRDIPVIVINIKEL